MRLSPADPLTRAQRSLSAWPPIRTTFQPSLRIDTTSSENLASGHRFVFQTEPGATAMQGGVWRTASFPKELLMNASTESLSAADGIQTR